MLTLIVVFQLKLVIEVLVTTLTVGVMWALYVVLD